MGALRGDQGRRLNSTAGDTSWGIPSETGVPMNDEIEQYLNMIEDLRGQVRTLIADLPADALNWRPLDTPDVHATNSLAVMTMHIAGAEHFWIGEAIGEMPPTRDRPAEFETAVDDVAPLLTRLDEVAQETRAVLTSLSDEDLAGTRDVRGKMVPVRWGILHVIDHTALHLGHMQITYQLWKSGETGPSPRWFERVSGE